ncbi:MAG: DUF1963 domain-containing protein [Planctomycetota bacterium]
MELSFEQIKKKLSRRAIQMKVGGFRPSGKIDTSYFGRVTLALPNETWPEYNKQLMWPLVQLNIKSLPFTPQLLSDIELITVFICPDLIPYEGNGTNWCLRAYKNIDELIPLYQKETGSRIKPFEMSPVLIENDYPCQDDLPLRLPGDIIDNYPDNFETAQGTKIGGWPYLIQSENIWNEKKYPSKPDYVFQIDSDEKANWNWVDRGLGYFARGTVKDYEHEWILDCQFL